MVYRSTNSNEEPKRRSHHFTSAWVLVCAALEADDGWEGVHVVVVSASLTRLGVDKEVVMRCGQV